LIIWGSDNRARDSLGRYRSKPQAILLTILSTFTGIVLSHYLSPYIGKILAENASLIFEFTVTNFAIFHWQFCEESDYRYDPTVSVKLGLIALVDLVL